MKMRYRIVLAGNPNCGKSCIFNALTGTRQHVGNYPGVTVESKSGVFHLNGMEIELIDLPGVYSLSASSPEEVVVFEELTRPGIDLILNVIDSTIPRRSLYLTTQLAELRIPMLLVFNMSDDAARKGLRYDIPKLETYFGAPAVQTVGCRSDGGRCWKSWREFLKTGIVAAVNRCSVSERTSRMRLQPFPAGSTRFDWGNTLISRRVSSRSNCWNTIPP